MEAGIYSRLVAYAGTTALVGTRVYPIQAPQNPTYPFIVYTRTDTSPVTSLIDDTTLNSAFLSVDSYAATFSEVKALRNQILLALKRYHGTSGGVVIEDAFLRGENHSYDPDLEIYQISTTFEVFYRS
jgi:hypothetical protein